MPRTALVRLTSALVFAVSVVVSTVLLATVHPAFADQFFEQNTDRPGSDIKNFEVTKSGGNFSRGADQVCQERCATTAGCVAWTFVKGSGDAGRCWLKNSIPAKRADSCCTSGVVPQVIEWNVDRPGGDYKTIDITNPSWPHGACSIACRDDAQCQAFTYVKQTNKCWLKNAVPDAHSKRVLRIGSLGQIRAAEVGSRTR